MGRVFHRLVCGAVHFNLFSSTTQIHSVSTLVWADAMIGPLALPFNVVTPGEWTQHMVGLCLEAIHSYAGQLAITSHECGCEAHEHIS